MVEVSSSFYKAIEELYEKYIMGVAKPEDKAQMLLKTDTMHSFISTPLRAVDDLTADHLLTTVEKSQNSGASIKFSDNLVIEFLHIRLDPGWKLQGGVGRPDMMYFNNQHQKKSCRQVTAVGKNTCLPACCIVGVAHEKMMSARKLVPVDEEELEKVTRRYKNLVANPGKNDTLSWQVNALYASLGVKKGTALDLSHLPAIEKLLDVSIKVVSLPDQLSIVYKSSKHPGKDYIYLLYSNPLKSEIGHYNLITNVRGFFSKSYYCKECDVPYWHVYTHRCKNTQEWWCFACHNPGCKKSEKPIKCSKCRAQFQSNHCQMEHEKVRCDKRWECATCHKKFFRKKVYDMTFKQDRLETDQEIELAHDCDKFFCRECKKEVEVGHKCFIKQKKYKDKIQRLLFFDLETDQSTKTHEVNYIHVIYYQQTAEEQEHEADMNEKKGLRVCLERQFKSMDDTKEEFAEDISDMEEQLELIEQELAEYDVYLANDEMWQGKWVDKMYVGHECLTEFCNDVQKKFEGYTCLAHNLKGFDGVFILRTYLENGIIPGIICKGQKVLEIRIEHADVRFIDSFNFLPMGLAKLPDAFGLDCGSKGYFPHFFNRPENQEYIDRYPDPKYYGVSQMSSSQRQNFYLWYKEQEGKMFNFRKEMALYCAQDVKILKESCMAYRRLMCQETDCDPFAYVTLASVCCAVYMTRFMPKKTIARVPASGYDRSKYSNEGYEWVEYLRQFGGIPDIQHAVNGGEVKIGEYFVDGYDQVSKTVYEYYGCFFHGCKKCYQGELRNPDTNKRLRQSYNETMRREQWFKKQGYNFVCIWGCDWKKQKQDDLELGHFVKAMKLPKPLDPRDSFYGGRTECFKIWTKQGPVVYHDVTSLYPWVNSTQLYPVGHPQIILSDFKDISEYFGIAQCTALPPRNLYLPVLPMHAGPTRKLLFPLCRSCAENDQQEKCEHTDDERSIMGTWCTEELKLAVEKGYTILEIHSVWHFSHTTRSMFGGYIRTFYRKKLLSSKLPYSTSEEIKTFMEEVEIKEDIKINSPDEFQENPGMRQITKLMLNNLWGRFGMAENMSNSKFISNFEELEGLLEDVTKEIQSVRVITDKVVQVVSRAVHKDFLPCSRDTNVFIALFTTAWARIRLYREMAKLGRRVIYCDTDSVIYQESLNPDENLVIGNFLGEMTSELEPDDHIVEFVSGGPKNYGYLTKNGKTAVKVKGFTLNSTNAPAFSFEKIKSVILNGVRQPSLISQPSRAKRRYLERAEFLDQHLEDPDDATAFTSVHGISVYNPVRIFRSRNWQVLQKAEQKLYSFYFNKRVINPDTFDTLPYGFEE